MKVAKNLQFPSDSQVSQILQYLQSVRVVSGRLLFLTLRKNRSKWPLDRSLDPVFVTAPSLTCNISGHQIVPLIVAVGTA